MSKDEIQDKIIKDLKAELKRYHYFTRNNLFSEENKVTERINTIKDILEYFGCKIILNFNKEILNSVDIIKLVETTETIIVFKEG